MAVNGSGVAAGKQFPALTAIYQSTFIKLYTRYTETMWNYIICAMIKYIRLL